MHEGGLGHLLALGTFTHSLAPRSTHLTPTGFWEEPVGYFEQVMWPAYLFHNHLPLDTLQQRQARLPRPSPPALEAEAPDATGFSFSFLDSEALGIEEMLLQSLRWIVQHYGA